MRISEMSGAGAAAGAPNADAPNVGAPDDCAAAGALSAAGESVSTIRKMRKVLGVPTPRFAADNNQHQKLATKLTNESHEVKKKFWNLAQLALTLRVRPRAFHL